MGRSQPLKWRVSDELWQQLGPLLPDPPPPPPKLALPPPPFIPAPEINIQAPVQAAPTITTAPAVKPPPAPVAAPVAPVQPYIRKDFKPSSRIEPTFPRQALQQGLSGRVKAWMHVAPSGAVTEVEIKESSNSLFNREVIRALSQWRFAAEPVGFIVEQEIVFNLKD